MYYIGVDLGISCKASSYGRIRKDLQHRIKRISAVLPHPGWSEQNPKTGSPRA